MKRFLSIITILVLTGCSPLDIITPKSSEKDFTYTNLLEKPSEVIHNIDDFTKIVDYNAFYKNEEFTLDASDYTFSIADNSKHTLFNELNYLYWNDELVNGMMGISATAQGTNWNIRLSLYNNATISSKPDLTQAPDIFYNENKDASKTYITTFATDDTSKPLCDVATTQQLWYAAEHNYCVNPLPNSPAAKYYKKCKDVLSNILTTDMTYYQKVQAIYDYIEHNSTYDYAALRQSDAHPVEDATNFPDAYCAQQKCFFIEGFFDQHTVVCDGYSKIFTLLGKMAGINIVRGSGSSDTRYITKEVAGHAYCFVEYEGTWYLACPTWGQVNLGTNLVFNIHNYFMVGHQAIAPYQSTMWSELNITDYDTQNLQVFENRFATYKNQTFDANIDDENEWNQVVEAVSNAKGTHPYAEVCITNRTLWNNIVNEIVDDGGLNVISLSQSSRTLLLVK